MAFIASTALGEQPSAFSFEDSLTGLAIPGASDEPGL